MKTSYHDHGTYHFRAHQCPNGKGFCLIWDVFDKDLSLLVKKKLSVSFQLNQNISTIEEAEKIANILNKNIGSVVFNGPAFRRWL